MRLGLLAYASPTGLGVQTHNYYRHLKPVKTMLVDLSPLDHYPHNPSLYEQDQIGEIMHVKGTPQPYEITKFCEGIDVLLIAETPLSSYLITCCRERKIKVILHYNYEYLDYLQNPGLPKPDLLLASSLWHWSEMQHNAHHWGVNIAFLPVPVDRERLPYTQRSHVRRFLHIAGHDTPEDRNGTQLLHEAIKLVKNKDVEFVIRSQRKITTLPSDKRVKIIVEDMDDYTHVYADEDCLLLPRRYGGLSLPFNEAVSQGMLVLMPNVEPQNLLLPSELLMPVQLEKLLRTRTQIAVYNTDPRVIAAYIEHLAKLPPDEVRRLSEQMNVLADTISWDNLRARYDNLFESMLTGEVAPVNEFALRLRYSNGRLQI